LPSPWQSRCVAACVMPFDENRRNGKANDRLLVQIIKRRRPGLLA
jgi:hypothetical protein